MKLIRSCGWNLLVSELVRAGGDKGGLALGVGAQWAAKAGLLEGLLGGGHAELHRLRLEAAELVLVVITIDGLLWLLLLHLLCKIDVEAEVRLRRSLLGVVVQTPLLIVEGVGRLRPRRLRLPEAEAVAR